MSIATARLKRLEKPSAFLLRLHRHYDRFHRLEEGSEEQAAFLRSLSDTDTFGLMKLCVTRIKQASGEDAARREMLTQWDCPEGDWCNWFLDGQFEEAALRADVEKARRIANRANAEEGADY